MRRGLTIFAVCFLSVLFAPASNALTLNSIQAENAKPGTTAWQLPGATATMIPAPSTHIEGYASQISVTPGDVLALHVSTNPAASYRVVIYRLGYYGGAGGRQITCLPSCTDAKAGFDRRIPTPDPSTGYLDARWPVTNRAKVTTAWTSGYYLAKLVLTSGPDRGQASEVPFIVRAAVGKKSAILVQASVNTWEAYNTWGGKSLYGYQSSGPVVPATQTPAAAMVSFDRPYKRDWNTTPLTWEYGLVRYLEQRGYDVAYTTDVDTDLHPASLLGHRLDVVNGHDEYWSPRMRDAWEAARDAGVNEVFMAGNIAYWQARYADSDRTLVEYRQANLDPEPDPELKTTQSFALNPPRPECTLLGVSWQGGLIKTTSAAGAFSVPASAVSNPWFAHTGLAVGAKIRDTVGYEWDTFKPGCSPRGTQVLLHWSGSPANADAVTYTASSRARVVTGGSMQLVWALSGYGHPAHADARVQALFANIFNDLGGRPGVIVVRPPVRLAARTRAQVLRHGFALSVDCARACRVRVVLRNAHGTLLAAATRTYRRGGPERFVLTLSASTRTRLRSAHGVWLIFQVATTIGHTKRTVTITARW